MPDSGTVSRALVVQSQEEERYRIARALQNGPAQVFANAALEIETFLRLMHEQPETARAGLVSLAAELRQGLVDVRGLIAELQPPLLGEFGLAASLNKHAGDFSKRTNIIADLEGWESLSERLPSTVEVAIFRIVQEALENVRTHAHATRVRISLVKSTESLLVTIEDNGKGFAVAEANLAAGRRLGLVAMSDRAEVLGGQLQIFSEPGHGVRVVLTMPLRGRPL